MDMEAKKSSHRIPSVLRVENEQSVDALGPSFILQCGRNKSKRKKDFLSGSKYSENALI